jgi:hypothetical protein
MFSVALNPALLRPNTRADGRTMCGANFCCLTSLTCVNVYNASACGTKCHNLMLGQTQWQRQWYAVMWANEVTPEDTAGGKNVFCRVARQASSLCTRMQETGTEIQWTLELRPAWHTFLTYDQSLELRPACRSRPLELLRPAWRS